MTYGYWLTRARVHLGEVEEQLAGTAVTLPELLSAASNRSAVYRQLARHAEMLIDPPVHRGRPRYVFEQRYRLAALRHHLRTVANDAGVSDRLAAPTPTTDAVRSLAAAADCLGVAGDILASHIEPFPHTPEGVAIRAGGGVVPASIELARVAFDAIAADLALTEWLEVRTDSLGAIGEPVAAAIRRTTTGRLPAVLGDVLTIVHKGPSLLHDLPAVPAINRPGTAVSTAREAGAAVLAVRTWLHQHPQELRAVHLRLGTQLGLAATLLACRSDTDLEPAARRWRKAAQIASQLEGTRPDDDGLVAARRLNAALQWTRAALDNDDQGRVEALTGQLPLLAAALVTGTARAIERGDLFVPGATLERAPTGVVRVTRRWLRATKADPPIVDLREALIALAASPDDDRLSKSRVRSAFRGRSRPTNPPPGAPQPSLPPDIHHRGR